MTHQEERGARQAGEAVHAKGSLPPLDFLLEILADLSPIDLPSGDVLLRQGEESDCAFYLERGALQVYAETRYGPVPLATLEAPRLIGEIGALAGLARIASVKAASAARVYRVDRVQLLELGRRSPDFFATVVRQLSLIHI